MSESWKDVKAQRNGVTNLEGWRSGPGLMLGLDRSHPATRLIAPSPPRSFWRRLRDAFKAAQCAWTWGWP